MLDLLKAPVKVEMLKSSVYDSDLFELECLLN